VVVDVVRHLRVVAFRPLYRKPTIAAAYRKPTIAAAHSRSSRQALYSVLVSRRWNRPDWHPSTIACCTGCALQKPHVNRRADMTHIEAKSASRPDPLDMRAEESGRGIQGPNRTDFANPGWVSIGRRWWVNSRCRVTPASIHLTRAEFADSAGTPGTKRFANSAHFEVHLY